MKMKYVCIIEIDYETSKCYTIARLEEQEDPHYYIVQLSNRRYSRNKCFSKKLSKRLLYKYFPTVSPHSWAYTGTPETFPKQVDLSIIERLISSSGRQIRCIYKYKLEP